MQTLPTRVTPRSGEGSYSLKRVWRLRFAAVLVGILPILIAELILTAWDLPRQPPAADPFVDLHNLTALFQPAEEPGCVETDAARLNLFQSVSFRIEKPADTFRVFALGGSTTYGEPYLAATAFPKWLELNLRAAAGPEKAIEVINCGGLSYASYRVLAILREVLQYDPDLVVVYTGQNEYLERRSYSQVNSLPPRWIGWLSHSRTVQCLRLFLSGSQQTTRARTKQRTELQAEVDALLDYAGGLEEYHRNDAWRQPVVAHFAWNLAQMCRDCRAAGVALVLVNPVTNLLDCPPFKFEPDAKLPAVELAAFERFWATGRAAPNTQAAIDLLQRARDIDPEHAGVQFALGQLAYQSGDYQLAKAYLVRARDLDVCPLRATSQLQQQMLTCSQQQRVPLVDADGLFSNLSEHGIVGERWLVDHVHPSVEGHQRLGEAIAEKVIGAGYFSVGRRPNDEERQRLYREHLNSLGEEYYQRGEQRLEGLLLWTQGRANKIREAPVDSPLRINQLQ